MRLPLPIVAAMNDLARSQNRERWVAQIVLFSEGSGAPCIRAQIERLDHIWPVLDEDCVSDGRRPEFLELELHALLPLPAFSASSEPEKVFRDANAIGYGSISPRAFSGTKSPFRNPKPVPSNARRNSVSDVFSHNTAARLRSVVLF